MVSEIDFSIIPKSPWPPVKSMLLAMGSIRRSWPVPQAASVEYIVPSFRTFTTKGQPEDGIRDRMDISFKFSKN